MRDWVTLSYSRYTVRVYRVLRSAANAPTRQRQLVTVTKFVLPVVQVVQNYYYYHLSLESQTCLVSSQLTQLAKIEVVRFWIGLIPLFIDWPQHGEEPYYSLRTPKWAKNDH